MTPTTWDDFYIYCYWEDVPGACMRPSNRRFAGDVPVPLHDERIRQAVLEMLRDV